MKTVNITIHNIGTMCKKKLQIGEKTEYISLRGKKYEIENVDGEIICFSKGKKCQPTKEILSLIEAARKDEGPPRYTIYSDGGCSFNPGGYGGYGTVIINHKTGAVTEVSGGYISSTNNRMEIRGAIEGIRNLPQNAIVTIISDSQYVVNTVNGLWRKKKNTDLWNEFDELSKGKSISAKWVRGHNGNEYNEICDFLATKAMFSENLKEDTGYLVGKEEEREFLERLEEQGEKSSAMSIEIKVENDSDRQDEMMSINSYAKEHQINRKCASSLSEFWLFGDRSFKAYAALKTGGLDRFSKMKEDSLGELLGEEKLDTAKKYLSEKETVKALRWHARGLSLTDSIRKVMVDEEINKRREL